MQTHLRILRNFVVKLARGIALKRDKTTMTVPLTYKIFFHIKYIFHVKSIDLFKVFSDIFSSDIR